MNLAIFCTKRNDFTLDVMKGNNVYPENLIITRTSLNNVPDEYKEKINVLYLPWYIFDIIELHGLRKLQQKNKLRPIVGTNMQMIHWEDSGISDVGKILNEGLLNLYNSINNTDYQIAEMEKEVRTRNKSKVSNACKIGIHFILT